MKLNKLLGIGLMLTALHAKAQQLEFVSQYMVDSYITNPAAAGAYDYAPISLTVRQQWVGFSEAPKTQGLSAHTNINNHHGVGLRLYNDVVGPLNRVSVQGSYAYHIQIDRYQKLSLGLSFLMNQHRLDGSSFNVESTTDQLLTNATLKSTNFDADFGIYYYSKDYYLGVSVPQLFQNKYKFGDNIEDLSEQVRHFYATGGYKFEVNNDFSIEPSFLMKAVFNAPLQFEISSRFHYRDLLWGGLSWRVKDAAVLMAGVQYENFVLGYAFDMSTNDLRDFSSGTHELYLAYRIPLKTKRTSFAR